MPLVVTLPVSSVVPTLSVTRPARARVAPTVLAKRVWPLVLTVSVPVLAVLALTAARKLTLPPAVSVALPARSTASL